MGRATSTRPPLLVFADDWGRHPSSCQHLVRRLREEFPVLWANTVGTRQVRADSFTFRRGLEKLRNWSQGLTRVHEQMWTIDLPMLPAVGGRLARALNRQLVSRRLRQVLASLGFEKPIVLTTLPYIGWLIRGLTRRGLVYYCTDDYSYWPGADRETLQEADREMGREADMILAVSHALQDRHAATGRCRYFPHAVDYAHFASAQEPSAVDRVVADLPRPRIGFFGLIYEKLDFALLEAVARAFRNGSLVLIGPHAWSPPEFDRLPNVHWLGPRPYEELPRYLSALDVLLLPYVDDPMIRRSSPLKLRECLASGRPTVSVDVPEVRGLLPHVRVAADRNAFVEAVRKALQEPPSAQEVRLQQQAVQPDSWDSRARFLGAELENLQPRPAVAKRRAAGRVLHLRTVCGPGGGPEKTLLSSPRWLRGHYHLRLAYVRPTHDSGYDLPQRAQRMGVDLVDIPERHGFDLRTLARLAREIQRFRPDILHAHDYKTNILAVLLGRLFGVRTVTTMHGYVSRGGRLEMYYRLDRWALGRLDHVIAVSEDLYGTLQDLGIPLQRRSLIRNGIDIEQYRRRHTAPQARTRLGLDPRRPIVGAVGRLAPEKGFDLLVRAHQQVLRQGLDADLVIAGEGHDRPRLEGLIAELGLGERVRLLGHRSDVQDLYEAMDVFVLSSLREGLPNVVLEAMALEVAVIATRIAGVPSLMEHEVHGLLVGPGSVEELAGSLLRLLGDAALRQRLAEAARRKVEQEYTFGSRMARVRSIYDRLLGRYPENASASVAAGV